MQLVTMTYKGHVYDLGHILPVYVGVKQHFIIVPNFEFRPPFILLRMERCYLRMQEQAIDYLNRGNNIPRLSFQKPIVVPPVHNILV